MSRARSPKKRMTTAEARRDWASVLRSATGGIPVEVTRHGEPVAVVLSFDEYRRLVQRQRGGLSEALAWIDEHIDPRDVEGPDPFAQVRDRAPGRTVNLR